MIYIIILIIAVILVLIIYILIGLVLVIEFDHKLFGKRTNDPDNPCYLTFEDFKDKMVRCPYHTYYYGKRINGYIYQASNVETFKGFVILSHGMFGTHIQYMLDINLMCENGYKVLAFDNYGCGISEGKSTVGLSNGIYCLENVIESVYKENINDDLPVFLYGHSWGGYSALGAAKRYSNIRGVISRSAPISPVFAESDLLFYFNHKLYSAYKPFINLIIKLVLPKRMKINCISGVKRNKNTKFLILYAKNDQLIKIKHSAAFYFENHPLSRVEVAYSEYGLHNSIVDESGTKNYIMLVKKYNEIISKENHEEELKKFVDNLDKKSLYFCQAEVSQKIIDFLDENSK